jgi:hypothetical protein
VSDLAPLTTMAVAMIYPEPERGGRGKRSEKSESLAKAIGVGEGHAANMISQARAVVPYPDLSR